MHVMHVILFKQLTLNQQFIQVGATPKHFSSSVCFPFAWIFKLNLSLCSPFGELPDLQTYRDLDPDLASADDADVFDCTSAHCQDHPLQEPPGVSWLSVRLGVTGFVGGLLGVCMT